MRRSLGVEVRGVEVRLRDADDGLRRFLRPAPRFAPCPPRRPRRDRRTSARTRPTTFLGLRRRAGPSRDRSQESEDANRAVTAARRQAASIAVEVDQPGFAAQLERLRWIRVPHPDHTVAVGAHDAVGPRAEAEVVHARPLSTERGDRGTAGDVPQIRATPSSPPAAKRVPSRLKATVYTQDPSPSMRPDALAGPAVESPDAGEVVPDGEDQLSVGAERHVPQRHAVLEVRLLIPVGERPHDHAAVGAGAHHSCAVRAEVHAADGTVVAAEDPAIRWSRRRTRRAPCLRPRRRRDACRHD